MKKKALAAVAILGATMGMGAFPQELPTTQQQSQSKSQRHNEATDKQLSPVRRGPVTPLNPAGINFTQINPGRSPKEYGQ
jgi:hypothetical protein